MLWDWLVMWGPFRKDEEWAGAQSVPHIVSSAQDSELFSSLPIPGLSRLRDNQTQTVWDGVILPAVDPTTNPTQSESK